MGRATDGGGAAAHVDPVGGAGAARGDRALRGGDADPDLGALRRVPQLAHGAHGQLADAVPRAAAGGPTGLRALAYLLAPVAVVLAWSSRSGGWPRRADGPRAWRCPSGVLALVAATAPARQARRRLGQRDDARRALARARVVRSPKSQRTHEDIMVSCHGCPAARSPEPVPQLHRARASAQRAAARSTSRCAPTDVCSVPRADAAACDGPLHERARCPSATASRQMRALDSTTALSMAAMLTGGRPSEPRAPVLLSAPLLPEYAHAAGIDAAFWTSQNLLYANAGRFLDGLPLHDVRVRDGARALRGLPRRRGRRARCSTGSSSTCRALREPYLGRRAAREHALPVQGRRARPAVLVDASTGARWTTSAGRASATGTRSTVRTSCSRASSPRCGAARRRAHGRRVPLRSRRAARRARADRAHVEPLRRRDPRADVDRRPAGHAHARRGGAQLRACRTCRVTELDVAPTLLDLLGPLGRPGARRPPAVDAAASACCASAPPPDRALVMTNCSELFSCAVPNWGVLRGHAQARSPPRRTGVALLRRRRRSPRDARPGRAGLWRPARPGRRGRARNALPRVSSVFGAATARRSRFGM